MNWVIFVLLRACGIDCKLTDVVRRRYEATSSAPLPSFQESTEAGIERALDVVMRLEDGEHTRRIVVDDKAKWLFGLASALLTVLVAVLSRAPFWVGAVGMVGVMLLTSVALILLWYFGINARSTPAVDADLMSASDTDHARYEVIRNTLSAIEWNSRVTDFHIDIYRAARRLVGTSLLVVAVMAFLGFCFGIKDNDVIAKVRADVSLMELLRGVPGSKGSPGPAGPAGPAGPKGIAGPTGRTRECKCKCAGDCTARPCP